MCNNVTLYKNKDNARGWAAIASAFANPLQGGAPQPSQGQSVAPATPVSLKPVSAPTGTQGGSLGSFRSSRVNRGRAGLNLQ